MTVLGVPIRELMGGRWAMSWLLVAIYVPLGVVAPLGNMSTVSPGTTVGQLLVASAVSLVPVVALLAASDVTWMRHRCERPLPIWSVVLLGGVLGLLRSGSMYAVSVEMGLQPSDLELGITRTITGGVQGAAVYPLAVLLVAVIARYRVKRRHLLAESVAIAERVAVEDEAWREMRAAIVNPLVQELQSLGDRLDAEEIDTAIAAQEVRTQAHELWETSRSAPLPRIRWSAALSASLRRQPFAITITMAIWFPTALGTVLASISGPTPLLGLTIGTTLAIVIFMAGNALVRWRPSATWAVVPLGIVLAALVTTPPGSLQSAAAPNAATTYFVINVFWFTLLILGSAIVVGAARQGESILAELHVRVDADAAEAARLHSQRGQLLNDVATTLHGRLQSRLVAGSTVASGAIRETVTLLQEPGRESPSGLNEAVAEASRPWTALLDITCAVRGDTDPTTSSIVRDVIEEALSNAFRHGDARAAQVTVDAESDIILIEVVDDGTHREGTPGMGSRLFDRAGQWTREATDAGTLLTVTIRPENY